MAGLGRAQRRSGGMEDTFRDYGPEGGFDVPNDRRDTARPRIGSPPRGRPARRKARDGLLLWRALALSASVLILGMGGVVAYHAIGSDRPAADGASRTAAAAATGSQATASPVNAPAASTASANGLKGASETRPTKATVKAIDRGQDGGHAQIATKVASILAAPAPAQPGRANPAQVASASPGPAEPIPTAADFARPAFLEPVNGDEAGDEASLPEGATQTVSDTAPPASAPGPKAKPRGAAVASADAGKPTAEDGRSARIRTAVTLRSGPKRSASAIGTLDEGTKVTLYSCKSWCEVSSGDKRGFVYKSAVAQ